MSDEIKIGDETLISSRRASQATGYAQDYIGQLARRGLIEGRRIGGLWYISESSLREYKEKADNFKPEPPQNGGYKGDDPDTIVSFDGREYVSAIKAASLTGYHQDYVGQLARQGKILSRQIGTRWYVDRDALIRHKKEKDALLAAVQAEAVGLRPKTDHVTRAVEDYAGSGPYMRYFSDTNDLFPTIDSASRAHEAPISPHVSAIISIPIRKIDEHGSENGPSRVVAPDSSSKSSSAKLRKRSYLTSVPVLVATTVIVVVVGYVSMQENTIYTMAAPKELGYALSGYVADVFEKFSHAIEDIVVPELIYKRDN